MRKIILLLFAVFYLTTNVFAEIPKEFTSTMVADLKFGKTNENVKLLQETLFDLGYFKVEEDEPTFSSKFDTELKNAILDFQESNELKKTGIINTETVKTLNELLVFIHEQNEEEGMGEEVPDVDQYSNELDDLSVDNYTSDIVDTYKSPDIFSYYEGIPGISLIKDVISNVFDSPKKESEKKGIFDIFECLLDPVCGKLE